MSLFKQGAFQMQPGMSPEAIKAHRASIKDMLSKYGTATYAGQGLAHMATGIVNGLASRKLDRMDAENAEKAKVADNSEMFGSQAVTDAFDAFLGGGGGNDTVVGPAGNGTPLGMGANAGQDRSFENIQPSKSGPIAGSAPAGSGAVDALVKRIIQVESGGKANAKNPRSSAEGLGQFIDSTWLNTIAKHRPDLARSMSRQQLLALKFDPDLSREMTAALASENEAFLSSRGHASTPGNLYLAHFAGPGGANKVLSADPNAPIENVLGSAVVRANPFLRGKTAGWTREWANRKMGGGYVGGEGRDAIVPTQGRAQAAPPPGWDSPNSRIGSGGAVKAPPQQTYAPQQVQFQQPSTGGMPELPAEFAPRRSTQEIGAFIQQYGPMLSRWQRERLAQEYKKAQAWEDPMQRHQMRVEYAKSMGWTPQQAQAPFLTDEEERRYGLDTAGVYKRDGTRVESGERKTQYVDGVGLIDMQTGETIQTYGGAGAKDRPMKQEAGSKRWRYTDGDKEYVFPVAEGGAGVGGDMTEGERKVYMFSQIQKQTGPAVNMIEDQGFDPSNIQDKFANGVLGGNFFKSTEGQMYQAAAGAWSEGALRLATGAAATPEEFARIVDMYFAKPGDSMETIAFKRNMRASYEAVMEATLRGDMNAELPSPLLFAVESYYNGREKPAGLKYQERLDVIEGAEPERSQSGSWTGPSLEEVKSMGPMQRAAMLSAYPVDVIPDDVLEFIATQGGN